MNVSEKRAIVGSFELISLLAGTGKELARAGASHAAIAKQAADVRDLAEKLCAAIEQSTTAGALLERIDHARAQQEAGNVTRIERAKHLRPRPR